MHSSTAIRTSSGGCGRRVIPSRTCVSSLCSVTRNGPGSTPRRSESSMRRLSSPKPAPIPIRATPSNTCTRRGSDRLARRGRPAVRRARGLPSSDRALRLDQPAPDRVAGEFDPVAHPELVEDVLAVTLDGLDADEEQLRDLLRGVRLRNQLEHLELARREDVELLLAASPALDVVADELRDC